MIIAVAGRKGGSSKSSTAVHLAGVLAEHAQVAALDLDAGNLTLADWAAAGHVPFTAFTTDTWTEGQHQPWEHVIIDAPARPTSEQLERLAAWADLVMLPTPPDAASLRVLARTLPVLRDLRATFRVLLARVPAPPSRDGDRAAADLERGRVPTFTTRVPELAVMRHAARHQRLAWDVRGEPSGARLHAVFTALGREVTS